jgi:hypothetical protein
MVALMMEPKFEDLKPIHVSLLDDLYAGEKLMSWYICYRDVSTITKGPLDIYISNIPIVIAGAFGAVQQHNIGPKCLNGRLDLQTCTGST